MALIAKVVTPDNVAEVLPRFFGLSRREAEAVAVSIHPAAAIPRREVVMPLRAIAAARSADVREELAPVEPRPRPGARAACGNGTVRRPLRVDAR